MKLSEDIISELIYKSICKTISEEENAILKNWLKDENNYNLYLKIINEENISQKISRYQNIDTDKAYRRIESQISTKSKVKYLNLLKYAAIFVGILTVTYFVNRTTNTASNEKLTIVSADIILQTPDNNSKIIQEEGTEELKDKVGNIFGIQNGNQLTYTNQSTQKELVYNTIIVPFGKKFKLVLSDGTKVDLNAGTSLKYPVNFIEGVTRDVFLTGEAFFDVAHDKKHPFIVHTDKLGVTVLGTKFNVNSYTDEAATDVTLIEGSVRLNTDTNLNNSVLLQPGFKGGVIDGSSKIEVQKVNTSLYTAWIHGELVIRNLPFKQIIKRLERQYNVNIKNENQSLDREKFNASFKNQSIENILIYFSETHKIEYQIKNNEIIIK